MKKKVSKDVLKDVIICTLISLCVVSIILNVILGCSLESEKKGDAIAYEPADEIIVEKSFYPGREYGDYNDLTFCFSDYLESIGASNVQRRVYTTSEDKNYELSFEFDGFKYKIITTEFKVASHSYGLFSKIEAKKDNVLFAVPINNSGTYVCDATSPFKVDWIIFDVFHAATDKDCELAKELRAGLDETNCPFHGLGIAHYELWDDGTTIWHDDLGSFTFDDGLDLHY